MMALFREFPRGRFAAGLLAVRVVAGAAMTLHGWPKIQNPTGWMGPDAPVPGLLQAAAAIAEFAGGIGWILGLLTPLFSFLLVCNMATAYAMVHLRDPLVQANRPGERYQPSSELALLYLAIALLLLLCGPGAWSLDALRLGGGRQPAKPTVPSVRPE